MALVEQPQETKIVHDGLLPSKDKITNYCSIDNYVHIITVST